MPMSADQCRRKTSPIHRWVSSTQFQPMHYFRLKRNLVETSPLQSPSCVLSVSCCSKSAPSLFSCILFPSIVISKFRSLEFQQLLLKISCLAGLDMVHYSSWPFHLSFPSLPICQVLWAEELLEKCSTTSLTKMQAIMPLIFPHQWLKSTCVVERLWRAIGFPVVTNI